MSFFFYLARCNDNSLYSGSCKNVKSREKMHNEGKGAKYTRARLPIKIVYFEEFKNRSLACKRESAVKKFTKKQKEDLIKSREIIK